MAIVTLKRHLRVFRLVNPKGIAVYDAGEEIPAGTQVEVAPQAERVFYDHCEQPARRITWQGAADGKPRFALSREYWQAVLASPDRA